MLLRPVTMNNTRPLRFTAAAGTKLAGPFIWIQSSSSSINNPNWNFLSNHAILLDRTFVHCPRFPTAAFVFGLFFSPTATERALTPAKDTWLGRPLPHQLPNPIKASLLTINNFIILLIEFT